jgi:hypothetical protein
MAKPKRARKEGGDRWTIHHFSQSNPTGKGQGFVPALLQSSIEKSVGGCSAAWWLKSPGARLSM